MLLKELYKPLEEYPKATKKQIWEEGDIGSRMSSQGSFSVAYNHATNPNLIIKIIETPYPSKDGYLNYLERIKRQNLPTNPQIEYIKEYNLLDDNGNTTGRYLFKICMERLQRAERLSGKQIEALLNRYFGDMINKYSDTREFVQEYSYPERLFAKFLAAIIFKESDWFEDKALRPFFRMKINDIRDPYLRKIAHIIRAQDKKGFGRDLHSGNIMFRLTPYGPQPVVTDPFTYR